jgi:lysophospholipase L1-like esterase
MSTTLARKSLQVLLALATTWLCAELAILAYIEFLAPRYPSSVPPPIHLLLAGDCAVTNLTYDLRFELGPGYFVTATPEHVNSEILREKLDEYVIRQRPDILYFNAGLGDVGVRNGKRIVPVERYEQNLQEIIRRVRAETKARLIWATITPVIDERRVKVAGKSGVPTLNTDIELYNTAARRVMEQNSVEIVDINKFIWDEDLNLTIAADGLHLQDSVFPLMARHVARYIKPEEDDRRR